MTFSIQSEKYLPQGLTGLRNNAQQGPAQYDTSTGTVAIKAGDIKVMQAETTARVTARTLEIK